MDIEAAAKAAFDAFHARFNRVRSWASHPDHDGVEPGRDTFRTMARAVAAMPTPEPEPAPVAEPEVEHLV